MVATLSRFLFSTLRGRLIVGVALVHAVMMTLFIADLTARQRAMLLERQVEEATALSQTLALSAAGWIAADDIAGLQELAEAQKRYPELIFAMLIDAQGRVLADTKTDRTGLYLQDLPRDSRQAVFSRSPALVDIAVPAMIGTRHVGWARVGIGQKEGSRKLAEITLSGIIYALAAIAFGSVIAWVMGLRLTRRLYVIQETINGIKAGDALARSHLAGGDEAAVMAREFDAMLDTMAERDAELRMSEEKFRSLIQKVQAAIVLHDGQGQILESNLLAQQLLGLSADQLLGKELLDPAWHFLREDGAVLRPSEYPVSRVLATGAPLQNMVLGIDRPDQERVSWVLINGEPIRDDAGAIMLVIVSFIDISERKLAEEVLRTSVASYRLAQAISHTGNWEYNLQTAEFWGSDEAKRIYGFDPDRDSFSTDDVERCIPERERVHQALVDLIEAGIPYDLEFEICPRNCAETRIVTSVATLITDEQGTPVKVVGVVQDITERKRTEEAVRRAESAVREGEERYRMVFENSPVSIWEEDFSGIKELFDDLRRQGVADIEAYFDCHPGTVEQCARLTRIIDVNRAALALHNAASKEELFAGLVTTFTPDSFATFRQELVCLWNGGTEMTRDAQVKTLGGEPRQVTVYFAVCPGYEETFGKVIVSLVDITERKQAEEAIHLQAAELEEEVAERQMAQENLQEKAFLLEEEIEKRQQMQEELEKLNENLELRVQQRTAELESKNSELERMNRLFIGRELRMVELKEQIKELKRSNR